MKKILAWFLVSSLAAAVAQAQDSATQQQLDKLSGQIQDVLAAQAAQEKRIESLEKQINSLGSQINQPGSTGLASQDDLQKLAQQVQDIDKKRQDDNQRVLKELERLESSLGASPPRHRPPPDAPSDIKPTPLPGHSDTGNAAPLNGYNYTVQKGDTLLAIVKAYREQGIKVTMEQVLKANPGLDPKTMKVGQKLFIPAPTP